MHTQNAKTERRANMQEYIMQENMEILGAVPSCNALNKVHYQVGIVDMMLGRKPMVIMSYIEHSLYKMSIATCVSSRDVDKYTKY